VGVGVKGVGGDVGVRDTKCGVAEVCRRFAWRVVVPVVQITFAGFQADDQGGKALTSLCACVPVCLGGRHRARYICCAERRRHRRWTERSSRRMGGGLNHEYRC
jgi:hypothetical protein